MAKKQTGVSPSWKVASPDRYGILKEYARENRKNMTEGETALWNALSDNALGVRFIRQYIIGDYIVDFYCRKNKLVIEVDGGYHSEPHQQEDDKIRQDWLTKMGYRVFRITNKEALFDTEKTVNKIIELINMTR
jgi:very-short-patch-repair endonuclease